MDSPSGISGGYDAPEHELQRSTAYPGPRALVYQIREQTTRDRESNQGIPRGQSEAKTQARALGELIQSNHVSLHQTGCIQ